VNPACSLSGRHLSSRHPIGGACARSPVVADWSARVDFLEAPPRAATVRFFGKLEYIELCMLITPLKEDRNLQFAKGPNVRMAHLPAASPPVNLYGKLSLSVRKPRCAALQSNKLLLIPIEVIGPMLEWRTSCSVTRSSRSYLLRRPGQAPIRAGMARHTRFVEEEPPPAARVSSTKLSARHDQAAPGYPMVTLRGRLVRSNPLLIWVTAIELMPFLLNERHIAQGIAATMWLQHPRVSRSLTYASNPFLVAVVAILPPHLSRISHGRGILDVLTIRREPCRSATRIDNSRLLPRWSSLL